MLFIVFRGPRVGVVKASKVMAHKLAVMTFAQGCAKIVSQVTIESREWARSAILDEIKDVVVDDSHDIGATSFTLADTKGRDSARLSRTHADACDFFELDVASEKGFGFASAASPRRATRRPRSPRRPRRPARGQARGRRPAPAGRSSPSPSPSPRPAPAQARARSRCRNARGEARGQAGRARANPTAYA